MNSLLNTVKNAAENGYRVFGVRKIREEAGLLNAGDHCPDSYDWDYENDISTRETTGETLGGACAILVDTYCLFFDGTDDDELEQAIESAAESADEYDGQQLLLIGGKSQWRDGWDENEVIIKDADVLAVIEK